MSDFYFRIKGDDLGNLTLVQKHPSVVLFEEKSLDVAKVKAEGWCRSHKFNALLEFEASTDDYGLVHLTGVPAVVK